MSLSIAWSVVVPNRDKINKQIAGISPGGATSLNDAIAFSALCMAGDPRARQLPGILGSTQCDTPTADQSKRINAVVLLSDGADNSSQTYRSITDLLKDIGRSSKTASDISIFTIGYGADADDVVLKAVAQQSGGVYEKTPYAPIHDCLL